MARRGSPFALSRQALNFFLLPVLWLNPRMTTWLAAFNAVSTLYLYLGSLHSERRLRRVYGPAYDVGVPQPRRAVLPALLGTATGEPCPLSP
jgi:hypothetical protein